MSTPTLANKGSGSLKRDMEGDIGEFIVEDEEHNELFEEFEDNEQFEEFGDILTMQDGGKLMEEVV